ncbi:MAG TPA: 23S rRNA (uracil(1939)-C(5))-methyltransferase RlmD [Gammaproteobacteria bacterium]|nr:23S rRNA (uracil(1939)-C(5))-methyltransferase RlmD [Gammaproteobacteria bacterium]
MSRQHKKKLAQEPIEAQITELNHEGRGVCHLDGKVTFVRGALAGERVRFIYTKKRRAFDEGQVVEVLQASPERTAPPCAAAGVCGGCSLQHLSPHAQIAHKQQILLEQLRHFGQVQPKNLLAPILGPTLAYRSKARLAVRYVQKKERVLVGFREVGKGFVADLGGCPILIAKVGGLFPQLADLIASLSVYQQIPQIEVAAGDQEIGLIFRHLAPLTDLDLQRLATWGAKNEIHIYLQPGGAESVQGLLETTPDTLSYGLAEQDLRLHFKPNEFTQINYELNEKMVNHTLSLLALDSEDCLLDLFCGVGNFSLPAARYADEVIGVEGAEGAVARAKENAQRHDIRNAQFYCADLAKEVTGEDWTKAQYNKVLLDPPRTGAAQLLSQISLRQVKKLVYVSCNAATLARDAGILTELGLTLRDAGVMDMFPHTAHVESIACFVRE